MALPIPIVVDNFADYYSEQVTRGEWIQNQPWLSVQKKLEAKELKREAQTAEDKWEMRKAILAKEALIESVCSTTKVGWWWSRMSNIITKRSVCSAVLQNKGGFIWSTWLYEAWRCSWMKICNFSRTGQQLREERTPARMAQLPGGKIKIQPVERY